MAQSIHNYSLFNTNSVQDVRGIPETTLYSYFVKSLSCTLQKSIAEALKTRMLNINRAKNCARSAVESDEFVIVNDHEFVRQQ